MTKRGAFLLLLTVLTFVARADEYHFLFNNNLNLYSQSRPDINPNGYGGYWYRAPWTDIELWGGLPSEPRNEDDVTFIAVKPWFPIEWWNPRTPPPPPVVTVAPAPVLVSDTPPAPDPDFASEAPEPATVGLILGSLAGLRVSRWRKIRRNLAK